MIKSINNFCHHTFSSLRVRNFRLYFIGQAISQSGTWMQTIGQSWLILKMTGSGASLGISLSLQFLPILIFAPFGGVITDRFDKHKFLLLTQSVSAGIALILTLLVATGIIEVWMIYTLSALLGIVNAFDSPARQSFVTEIAGKDKLHNAISLISTQVNLARIIGPVIAGLVIAKFGFTLCFLLNSASYMAVILSLILMNKEEIDASEPINEIKGELSKGFQYIKETPVIRDILIIIAIVGTLSYNFLITLPLLARNTFHSDASSYGLLASGIAIGAVLASLFTARHKKTKPYKIVGQLVGFGISIILVAISPNINFATFGMIIVGFFSIIFLTTGSTIIQTESVAHMRGRVISMWTVGLLGSTAIGAPLIGWISEPNPRCGLIVGGVASLLTAIFAAIAFREHKPTHKPV